MIFFAYLINGCCKFNAAAFPSIILDGSKPFVGGASSSWTDRYNTGVRNKLAVWRVLMLKAKFPPRTCFWHWRFETLVRKTCGFGVNLPVDRNPPSAWLIFVAFDHAFGAIVQNLSWWCSCHPEILSRLHCIFNHNKPSGSVKKV